MHVCLLPPGHMLQVGVVLVGKPQWSTCHGVTSPVAVCVCVFRRKGGRYGGGLACSVIKILD